MSDRPESRDPELGISFGEIRPPQGADAQRTSAAPTIEEVARDAEGFKGGGGVFDVGEAEKARHELGTIVTDRKKRHASLSDNVSLAFNQWIGKMRKTTKPVMETLKPKEVPKVEKVEKRVDVLETAATHASMAPKDDHKVVIEKIKTFKRDVERVRGTPFMVKEEPKDKQPTWSHTIDTSKPREEKVEAKPIETPIPRPSTPPDLRSTMVAPVVEKHIKGTVADFYKEKVGLKPTPPPKRSTTANQIAFMHIPGTVEHTDKTYPKPTPAHIAPIVEEDKPDVPKTPSIEVPPVPRETIGYVARESARTREPSIPAPPPPIPPEFRAPTPTDVPSPVTPPPAPIQRSYVTPKESPVHGVLYTVLGGAATVFVILFLISSGRDGAPLAEDVVVPPASVVDVDQSLTLPLSSRETFFAELAQKIGEAEAGIVTMHPVIESEGSRPATSQEFFTMIEGSLPQSTVRLLDPSFSVGSVTTSRNEPFLVLRSPRFDDLFAGLLAWEPRMRSDLSPLFDTSFVERDVFTDTVKGNRPVRVLYDALGNEVLLYTIVGDDTAIITSSEAALSELLQAL